MHVVTLELMRGSVGSLLLTLLRKHFGCLHGKGIEINAKVESSVTQYACTFLTAYIGTLYSAGQSRSPVIPS